MSQAMDMFLINEIEAERQEIIDAAKELFQEAIQHAGTENPHMYFWFATLNSRSRTLFYSNQRAELRTWCREYVADLIAWLQLNYLDPGKFYSTGTYSRVDHVLAVH